MAEGFGAFAGAASGSVIINLITKDQSLTSGLNKASKSLINWKNVAITAGVAAAGAMSAFMVSSIKAAAEAEQFAFSVKQSYGDMADAVLEASNRMQLGSIQTDEAIQQAFVDINRRTANMGLTFEQQSKLIQGSLDFAAQSNIDFASAVEIVTGAVQGKTKSLQQMGLEMRKGATDGEILTAVVNRLGEAEGAAQAQTETLSGSLAWMANQWDEIKESVGKEIAPQLKEFFKIIKDNKDVIVELADAFIWLVGGIAENIANIVKGVEEFGMIVGATIELAIEAFGILGDVLSGDIGVTAGLQAMKTAIEETTIFIGFQTTQIWGNIDAEKNDILAKQGVTAALKDKTIATDADTISSNNNAAALSNETNKAEELAAVLAKLAGQGRFSAQTAANISAMGYSVEKNAPGVKIEGGGWTQTGNQKYKTPSFKDMIWRPGQAPIEFSPNDTIVAYQNQGKGASAASGMGGSGVTYAPTYNIVANDKNEMMRLIESHDNRLMAELRRNAA